MECNIDDSLIQQYLDGELGRLEGIVLEEHIKGCSRCKKELTEMKLLFSELEDLHQVEVPKEASIIRENVILKFKQPSKKGYGIKKYVDTQRYVMKASSIYLKFIPGTSFVEKSIKKVPSLFQRAAGAALSGGIKLVMARAKA